MSFTVSTDRFSGPLDALLGLIEDRKVPVEEMPLSVITDEFVRYLQEHEPSPHELADYIVVLVRLLFLKSHNALKLPPDEPLLAQLQNFALVREARKLLQTAYERRREMFSGAERTARTFSAPTFSLNDLHESALSLVAKEHEHITELRLEGTVKIEEAIATLRTLLEKSENLDFSAVGFERGAVAVFFLAILLLAKTGYIGIEQDRIFGKIYLRKANGA